MNNVNPKSDTSLIQEDSFEVACIGIIVQESESVPTLNKVLHEYGNYIIGRMGIPYKQKSLNVISLVVDAPSDVISAMAGKIGMIDGVSSKTIKPKISK
ncbi:MAG: TM1266 family iron-only hydrogenase system putative regulator [Anaerotardibacter sp.]